MEGLQKRIKDKKGRSREMEGIEGLKGRYSGNVVRLGPQIRQD